VPPRGEGVHTWRARAARAVPSALVAAAAALYTAVSLYRLACFYPLDFDLAIYGQGVWLLASGESPHVTVRGLHLFGDHATWIHLPVALIATLVPVVRTTVLLVLLQSAALAWAAHLVHRTSARALGPGTALAVLAAFLAYPALQHTWLEYYEPVNLAIPCLIAAGVAVLEGRDRHALWWSLLALATIEYVAISVVGLGLVALAGRRRRLGLPLIAVGALYLFVVARMTAAWFNPGGGFVYGQHFYGEFADSLPDALAYLAHPGHLLARVLTRENGLYVLALLAPVAFLPLGAPSVLLGATQLAFNMVSSWHYAREIRYHYVAPIIPFVFLALIRALGRLPAGSRERRRATVALLAALALSQPAYASRWLLPTREENWWRGRQADRTERSEVRRLLAIIPPAASVSAHYRFLPALCERTRVYMFPEMGPGAPDAILVETERLATDARGQAALDAALAGGGYARGGATSSGTVLWLRPVASRGEDRPVGGPPSAPR
jgi:uncharacterized membrane protein